MVRPPLAVYEQVRQKLASSGPSGTPSPYVRERVAGSSPAGLALRVRFEDNQPGGPCLRVLRADGSPAIPTAASAVACGDPARAAATAVQQLEHVARWEQLRDLGSHRSALADAVQLRIYPAGPGETALPPDRQPFGLAGEYTIPYGTNGEPPNVFMHLKNTSDRDLHVALLDLTDRLECDVLYQTKTLAAGTEDNVNSKGGPMKLTLSSGVDPVPGARTQDWLKIIVSESPFEANAFELAAVGEQARSSGTIAEQHAGADRRPNRQPRSHGRRPGTVRAVRCRLVRHHGRIGRGSATGGLRPRQKGTQHGQISDVLRSGRARRHRPLQELHGHASDDAGTAFKR